MPKIDEKFIVEQDLNERERCYNINELKKNYDVQHLFYGKNSQIWVVKIKGDAAPNWCRFEFMEYLCGDDEGNYVQPFLVCEGPSKGLRELRHSWWGNYLEEENTGGYLFYMNTDAVRRAMNHLDIYYDN